MLTKETFVTFSVLRDRFQQYFICLGKALKIFFDGKN